ncbi:MAG: InlB B-repeat-containing protein [Paludibacteraceae bacterium]|nr:InlB B-repeat-containing protein [Paludibacteraceae bacterium]
MKTLNLTLSLSLKSLLLTATLLLTCVGEVWGGDYQQQGTNAGWWSDGGLSFNWTKNATTSTTTLNYSGIGSGGNLGDITTALTLTKTTVKFWRTSGSGNICGSTVWWELFKESNSIESGSYDPATWGSWDGSNNTMTNTTSIDFYSKTTGPGNYTIKIYAKLTGGANSSSSCNDNFWYNNNNTGTYSITFTIPSKNLTVAGAANGNTVSGSVTGIVKGTAYPITATPTTGYSFGGWTATSGGSSITIANSSSASTSVTFNNYSNDATVTARFKADSYTVTLNTNSGTINADNVTSYTYGVGATLPTDVTRTGYMFGGWYDNDTFTGSPVTTISTTATGNKTYYAKWTEITITDVTVYPSSGGTGNQTMTVKFKTNAPRNSGYYYRIAEFGGVNSGTIGGGFYINGVVIGTDNTGDASTLITVSPFTPYFGTSGVYTAAIEIYTDGPVTVQKTYNFTYGAGNYYTVSFNMNGHGSAVSSQSVLSGATATRPSPDPTATGYTFGGWYQEAACTNVWNFSTAITAARTLFAKWTPKTTTITLDRQSGTGGSSSVTATYDAAMPSATMPTRTNYTFAGYWSGENGTGTKYYNADGSSAHTWNYEDATKTLYAYWTENTYTVNVALSDASQSDGTTAPNGDVQVGAVTPVQITAPMPRTGYLSTGQWTATGGVVLASTTDNPTTITATSAGTVRWTFDENLTSNCVLKGSFNSWGDGIAMTKHAGESTGTIVYCTKEFTASSSAIQIKIMEGETWFGAQDSNNSLTKNTGSSFSNIWTLTSTNGGNNINFYPSVTGTYTFKYDYSTHKLQVYYPVVYQLQVYSASPADVTNTNNFDWDSHVGNVYSKTLSLNANTTYEFKCVVYSDFYGNTGTMTSTSSSNWDMSINVANCKITTTVAGNYKFDFTYTGSGNGDTKRLTVTYPKNKILSCEANSWAQSNNSTGKIGSAYYWDVTLPADNLQEFKIIDNSVWYGAASAGSLIMTSSDCSSKTLTANGMNAKIATTTNATYRILYDTISKQVSVTYPTIPAMTGSLLFAWDVQRGPGNGTSASPYEVFQGQTIQYFKFTHNSHPTIDSHFKRRFLLDGVEVIAPETPAAVSPLKYNYSNGAENTLGDHTVTLEVYYEYGPEGYKVKGTAQTSTIYYKVVPAPIATITSDLLEVAIGDKFNLTASLSTTLNSSNPYNFYKDGVGQPVQNSNRLLNLIYYTAGTHNYYVVITDYWGNTWMSPTIYVNVYDPANSIVVRFNTSEVVSTTSGNAWGTGMKVHYWGANQSGADVSATAEGDNWYSAVVPLCTDGKVSIQATATTPGGNNDMRTANIENVNESGCYIVKVTKDGQDHRLWEKTEDCQLYYAVESTVGTNKYYSNRVHKDGADLSFYANTAGTLNLVRHNNGEGWEIIKSLTPSFSKDSVYTSTFVKNTLGIGTMVAYSGAYYLYSPAVAAGKEHKDDMDSTFIHFDGNEAYTANPYNYYWVDWFTADANVSATIGNHINNNLSQAITDEGGFTNSKVPAGGANVRFAYNPKTNYFSRSAIGPAGDLTKRFLMLYDKDGLTTFKRVYDTDGTLIENPTDYDAITSNAATGYYRNAVFNDDGNWVYEIDVKATSASRVIAHSLFNGNDYYLFGMDGENPKAVQLHTAEGTLTMRVIYDFKTNRIVAGWVPDDDYNGTIDLNSAVIFLREANNDSKQVKLTGNNKVTNITQVYTVLELRSTNWNTTGGFFWFSLPYSCKIADMFGLGEYGTDWVIQRYRGDLRAQNGWFKETPTFWRNLKKTATLEVNRGYVVYLMNSPTFKSDGVARLYFPSEVSKWEFEPKAVTTTLPYNECTICQGCEQDESRKGNKDYDRTKEDSHWYVAGVPAFQNCTISAHSATIKNDNVLNMSGENPLYYYEWNYNSGSPTYTPRSSVGTEFKSTFAYMFQYAGNITWVSTTGISASTPSGIAARRVADEEGVVEEMTLQLTNGEDVFDHAYITLNDIATSDYDLNLDLSKIMNDGPQIYSLVGSYNMAANQLPHSATEVPLGIVFPETGEYQIALAKGMPAGKSVSIYDAAESREYSLENPVTVYADSAHTSVGRYSVRIQKKQGQITTAADNTLSGTISVTQADGRLFISGIEGRAEAMLYDMTGKLLYRTLVESGEGIAAPQQGIYLMRVAGQTLKINIR